jgi:NAD(P)H-dependent flavin oxidoreductase YrpB (nitropropane dioxygenase family)
MMGQIAGLVKRRAPVKEIIETMVAECNAALEKAGRMNIPAR